MYLVNEINPKNPNKELVKKFQKITMGLKQGDIGYGVFGPQTTEKLKEYNQLLIKKQKKSILAVHEGKIEKIKFNYLFYFGFILILIVYDLTRVNHEIINPTKHIPNKKITQNKLYLN